MKTTEEFSKLTREEQKQYIRQEVESISRAPGGTKILRKFLKEWRAVKKLWALEERGFNVRKVKKGLHVVSRKPFRIEPRREVKP